MSQRVLILDDDPILLRFARLHLEQAGYEVSTTSNPLLLALEIGTTRPDLVLLDVEMPALSGAEVLAALRRTACHLKTQIVLFSSLSQDRLNALSQEFCAAGFIRKASPLDGPGLVRRVRGFLRGATTSSAAPQAAARVQLHLDTPTGS